MPQTLWSTPLIKQCETETGIVLLREEQDLFLCNQDFSHLKTGQAQALFKPLNEEQLQKFLFFVNQQRLPVTIRSNGLSQSGQSLAVQGGVVIDISHLNTHVSMTDENSITAGANATWKQVFDCSLLYQKIPYVLPYNTNLSIGGVLSVGGIGASSFREGIIAAHVDRLKVMLASGEIVFCSPRENQDLLDACLAGLGLFAIILEADIKLRPCKASVCSYLLKYDNYALWLEDQFYLKDKVDYLEAFIDSDQALSPGFFSCFINIGIEGDGEANDRLLDTLHFTNIENREEKTIGEYLVRHNPRINRIKESGLWEQKHPWYECYLDKEVLLTHLFDILPTLQKSIGGVFHVFPIHAKVPKFFMLPESSQIVTFNTLSPGLDSNKIDQGIADLKKINQVFLESEGKRYISGWFPNNLDIDWQRHYGALWDLRKQLKNKYDPNKILCSLFVPEL